MEKTIEEWQQEFESGKLYLKDVPIPERTKDVCLAAIKAGRGDVWGLHFLPPALHLDQDVWDAAYANGIGFGHVPEACRSKDMCAKAVENWPLNLRFVPDAMKTPEMCADAFARDARACFFVPNDMKTDAMCTAIRELQDEWKKATANAEAPDEAEEEAVAGGGHVKVRQVAFLNPGTRFPRYGECSEDVQNLIDDLDPDDIIVSEWGEPGGNPEWQYQLIRHAVMPDDFDGDEDFNPADFEWNKGVDYAWNEVAGVYPNEEIKPVFWRHPVNCSEAGEAAAGEDADSEEEVEAAAMGQMSGLWARTDWTDMFPLKFGDLWYAYGMGSNGQEGIFDVYDDWNNEGSTTLLRDAMLWANAGKEGFTHGKAEVLAHLALDDLMDDETDLEGWFADAMGADAWMKIWNGGRYSGWIYEDETGGTAMSISKNTDDPDLKQLFEDVLPWGAIATVIHYGDYDPDSGREMNAYLYDDFASWGIAAPKRGIHFKGD